MPYTKEQRKLYQREYRAKHSNTPTVQQSPTNIDVLKKRIEQWNLVQGIKKQELGLLPNIWSSNNAGMYRQRFYALQGSETGIDQISREQVVRLSRELFFQLPGVGVASELKGQYVVGNSWKFCYRGDNEEWGKEAEAFINDKWFHNCSTKGFAYPFQTILKVLSRTLDMDGDILMLLVRNNQDYPLLQFVSSHRIGSDSTTVTINGKKYKCYDGIVYDDNDAPMYYSIKKDDAQIATVGHPPKTDINKPILVSVKDAALIFKPIVMDKCRGLPALYSGVLYGLQLQDLDNFLMDIAKIEATIAYTISNDAGQAPIEYENLLNQIQSATNGGNSALTLPAVSPTVHGVSMVKSPTINYVTSDGGELKSFHSDRPSEQIQSYIRSLETKLLSAIGIPHQIIYSPETISGRAVNAVTQLVRKSVSERQSLLKRYCKLAVAYALSSAMENGYISKNYDEDLNHCIDFTMPPEFTLDINDDNKMNIERYKMGLISGEQYSSINDESFKEVSAKRKEEIFNLLKDVQEAKSKFPDMSEATILNLFTQRGQSTLAIEDVPSIPPTVK